MTICAFGRIVNAISFCPLQALLVSQRGWKGSGTHKAECFFYTQSSFLQSYERGGRGEVLYRAAKWGLPYLVRVLYVTFTNGSSVQFSSVAQSCLILYDPMNCSPPGLPVHHQLLESTQTHIHWVGDAFQPSHPLSSPSPPALNLSQHQGLFKWVSSSHQVAKVLEFQLQHQSFQWTPRIDLL